MIPASIHVLFSRNPKRFFYSLFNASLGFFLFSFQVHEKSIMIPCLPMTLLIEDEPAVSIWFNNIAVYSLFPLLQRDGLVIAYIGVMILWNTLSYTYLCEQKGAFKHFALVFNVLTVHRCVILLCFALKLPLFTYHLQADM